MAQVGTFCIACAILTLPDVGPRDQPGQDPILLLTTVAAILWGAALTVATVACCVGMVALARRSRRRRPTSGGVALGVYVTAQVTPSHLLARARTLTVALSLRLTRVLALTSSSRSPPPFSARPPPRA